MSHIISYPMTRYGFSGVIAFIVASFLFYLMQHLIRNEQIPSPADAAKPIILDFISPKQEVRPPERKRIDPPQPPADPPPFTEPELIESGDFGETLSVPGPEKKFEPPSDGPVIFGTGIADLISLVKIQPVYPPAAKRRGIEGFVIVEFTVTESGTTKDVKVIEADPPGLFDQAAIRAALKFKYKPRMLGDKAVEVTGVQNKFTFEFTGE